MRVSYQKSKLNNVQELLGYYFHTAINDYFLSPEKAYKKLIVSGYFKLIEEGNNSVIYGKSGRELFYDVMNKTSDYMIECKPLNSKTNTKEFWAGWILAYYQWSTSKSFDLINEIVPFNDIIELYNPYHEMDERSFVADINERYFNLHTKLSIIRKRNQLTQSELSDKASLSIRTIQMLEQRRNDINNAKAINLYRISKVLNCSIEDLLE